MDGIALGARFSLATNRLKFCGPEDAEPLLYRAAAEGTGLEQAALALSRFEALYPYLKAIAHRWNLSPWDRRVIEAYWIGNDLLDGFGPEEFRGILQALVLRGLPSFVAQELSEHLPARPLPHHVFHVAYVGVGAVTGHVPTTVPNMELCRPSWGRVRSIGPNRLELEAFPLALRNGRLGLGEERTGEVRYDPKLLPGLRVGATVAAHWGWAAVELTDSQRASLERYTTLSLEQANLAHGSAQPGAART